MNSWHAKKSNHINKQFREKALDSSDSSIYLHIVDICILGIIFIAPIFLGGRDAGGRFIFISLACVAGFGWFLHQAKRKKAAWPNTWAYFIGLSAIILVIIQLVPLPPNIINLLSPRTVNLLPLWSAESSSQSTLGIWPTLSLTPSLTKISLATLIAYVLLFTTVVQRLNSISDIERLLRLIVIAAILMSVFGLIQYFTSNGKFFWYYNHPFTNTDLEVKGTFSCRNHFAHFLALGLGPLLAWIVHSINKTTNSRASLDSSKTKSPWDGNYSSIRGDYIFNTLLVLGLIFLVFGILLSLSRAGALAMCGISIFGFVIYMRHRLISGGLLYGLAAFAILLLGLLTVYGHDRVSARLSDFTTGSIDKLDRNSGRRNIWLANIESIKQGGWFGAGAGSHKEIYPIYLSKPFNKEYTHAENGPIQITTECGFSGAILLGLAILIAFYWCWKALKLSNSTQELTLAVGVSSSLLANVIHSTVDFAWFIPACMSLTILLASCAFRLAQIGLSRQRPNKFPEVYKNRLYWIGLASITLLASVWSVYTTLGPALASSHWDKYLHLSNAKEVAINARMKSADLQIKNQEKDLQQTELMIYHLQNALSNDPTSARIHARLASKYLQLFDLKQQNSENAMSAISIRNSAILSRFSSAESLKNWLQTAFEENHKYIYRAYYHTKKSLQLCPLQGNSYNYLATLCFLEGQSTIAIKSYLNQAMLVRPYDVDVLFEVGRQNLLLSQITPSDGKKNIQAALDIWNKIFSHHGIHQTKIINLVASQLPANVFVEFFKPDWNIISPVWNFYCRNGNQDDLTFLLEYASNQCHEFSKNNSADEAASVHYSLATMFQEMQQSKQSLKHLLLAQSLKPNKYLYRRKLGQALLSMKQYKQAEIHLRWCISRNHDSLGLRNEILEASKGSLQTAQLPTMNNYR